MELLSDFDPSDQVSQLLRVIRIRSTVYCRSVMRAPWGFGVQAHGHPAFHVVTAGRCWLEVDGQPGQIPLEAGDFAILPRGNRHWMRDAPATPVTELEEVLATTPLDADHRLRHGGSGPAAGLLCGGFAVESGPGHPILHALPAAVVIRGTRGRPPAWLSATLDMLNAEAAANAPGAQEVVTRLADVLLTQALRAALSQLGSSGEAGLLTLRDRQIASAIKLIHAQPERGWTVGELASQVALSRSAFSARFRELVGESPLRYITRTRLAHAAAWLRTTDAPLAQIAARAGYGTEFSFGKAFKRTFGIAPGAYRGQPGPPPVQLVAVPGRAAAPDPPSADESQNPTGLSPERMWLMDTDDEFAISYMGVSPGVPVLTRDGEQFGFLEHVLQVPEEDIFEGIVVWVGGGTWANRRIQRDLSHGHASAAHFLETFQPHHLRFVEADKVSAITVGYIRCDLDQSQAGMLPPPSSTPVIQVSDHAQTYRHIFGKK